MEGGEEDDVHRLPHLDHRLSAVDPHDSVGDCCCSCLAAAHLTNPCVHQTAVPRPTQFVVAVQSMV